MNNSQESVLDHSITLRRSSTSAALSRDHRIYVDNSATFNFFVASSIEGFQHHCIEIPIDSLHKNNLYLNQTSAIIHSTANLVYSPPNVPKIAC